MNRMEDLQYKVFYHNNSSNYLWLLYSTFCILYKIIIFIRFSLNFIHDTCMKQTSRRVRLNQSGPE